MEGGEGGRGEGGGEGGGGVDVMDTDPTTRGALETSGTAVV